MHSDYIGLVIISKLLCYVCADLPVLILYSGYIVYDCGSLYQIDIKAISRFIKRPAYCYRSVCYCYAVSYNVLRRTVFF